MIKKTKGLPVSFEVFSDEKAKILEQARIISKWGENVYVKIPICNTKGENNSEVITILNKENIKLNITAVFSKKQIKIAYNSLKNKNINSIISIFAGRISDTGIDCKNYIKYAVKLTKNNHKIEILWASVREVYNIFDAIKCNCNIITITDAIFKKINYIGKDIEEFLIDTVKGFFEDSIKSEIYF